MESKKVKENGSYGKIIWRSKLYPGTKIDRLLGYGLGFSFLILPIIVCLFLQADLKSFIGGQIVSLLLGLPFIHVGLRASVSYIIIYEKGIVIRKSKPIVFLNSKFFSFEQIIQANVFGKIKETSKLIIFIKDLKPFEFKSRWVFNFKEGRDLILKYKKNIESKKEKNEINNFLKKQIPDIEYAIFFHRIMAWLIDILIVVIISAIIYSGFLFQIKFVMFRIIFTYLIIHIIGFL
ncbi:MAG: hypothetical protein ACFFAO_19230 [Candidatus Hermodarchaeota archaeon]